MSSSVFPGGEQTAQSSAISRGSCLQHTGLVIRRIAGQNPYRMLGVCANSSQKERLANVSRMAAFLRVKRQIDFPFDRIVGMEQPVRSEELVNDAVSSVALPGQRLYHALFWFIKETLEDDAALEQLVQGNLASAESIWLSQGGVSASHNLALCFFLTGKEEKAVPILEQLYAEHSVELGQMIDVSLKPSEKDLVEAFLSHLEDEDPEGTGALVFYVSRRSWKERLGRFESERLMQIIQGEEGREEVTAKENLEGIQKLVQRSLPVLRALESLMGADAPAYVNLADQVATLILQGAIRYYNRQDETVDVCSAVLQLMETARDIARGNAVRSRCVDNMRVVQSVLEEQPTEEMGAEGQSVYALITMKRNEAPGMSVVRSLLKETGPHLKTLRKRVGRKHSAYLKLSSLVVEYAIKGVFRGLEEALGAVEEARKRLKQLELPYLQFHALFPGELYPLNQEYYRTKERAIKILREAWTVLRKLEFYDMEPAFRREKYDKNRERIKKICVQSSVKTEYFLDTIRRHPCVFGFIALALVCLMGYFVNYRREVQSEEQQLQTLVYHASTKEDWQEVKAKAKAASLTSYRFTALQKATVVLKQIEKEEKERKEQELSLLAQYQQAESQEKLQEFVAACSDYLDKYGEEASEEIQQCQQKAEVRITELKNERIRNQILALLKQYDEASTRMDLASFIAAVDSFRQQKDGQPERLLGTELDRCYDEARKRIDEIVEKKENELRERYGKASSIEDYNRLAVDAKELGQNIPSMAQLARDAQAKADELRQKAQEEERQRLWGSEENAWATVLRENTLAACKSYLQYYPNGLHAEQAKKRIIDEEVNDVFASGEYGQLPTTERTRRTRSTTANITITNDTKYTLTIMYSGPSSLKLEIRPNETKSVKLPAATYRVVASVDASRVRPFAGTETYSGGSYEASYYISSTPVYKPSSLYGTSFGR